jgi:hypothetical protein
VSKAKGFVGINSTETMLGQNTVIVDDGVAPRSISYEFETPNFSFQ